MGRSGEPLNARTIRIARAVLLALAAALPAPLAAQDPPVVPGLTEPLPADTIDVRPSEPIPVDATLWGLGAADTISVLAPRFEQGESARALAAVPSEDIQRRNPRNAAIRSFLLPGWGQFYTGHRWRGIVFAAAEVG